MASNDADRQINQMIDFIIAEANEKAEEIRQKANAEHESQYQEMLRELQYVRNQVYCSCFQFFLMKLDDEYCSLCPS